MKELSNSVKLTEFSKSVKQLFRNVMIHKTTFKLNGSFNNSYWAGDIDMYQSVTDKDISAVYDKIQYLTRTYMSLELKIVEDDGTTTKVLDDDIDEYVSDVNLYSKSLTMIKLDFVMFLAYPIEASIIYDVDAGRKYDISDVINDMLEDVVNYQSVYKGVKRLNSIASLLGYNNMFEDILQQTKYGALYISNIRIDLLNRIRDRIDPKQFNNYMDTLHEDLRRIGLKTRDFNHDLIQFLKKSITN